MYRLLSFILEVILSKRKVRVFFIYYKNTPKAYRVSKVRCLDICHALYVGKICYKSQVLSQVQVFFFHWCLKRHP